MGNSASIFCKQLVKKMVLVLLQLVISNYQLPHAGIQSCLGCVLVFLKKSVLESELYREEVCQQLANSHLLLKEYLKAIDRFFAHCVEGTVNLS